MKQYSVSEYTSALNGLLPTGMAWTRNPNSVMSATIRAIAHSYHRSDQDSHSLLEGSFPATATIMLSEWEKSLGLPDDCAIGEIDSISLRQKSVVSKLLRTGGQSKSYFIGLAAELGFKITITEFRQARAGMSACGDALNGEDWPFVWRINAPTTTINYAVAGGSYCGDPLRSWGNQKLECQFNRLSPSHTILKFGYGQQ
ncbi:YmfQ family protein [Xenorhabdus bovienii]|uniref:YmfQ family protein n=1 Tax=Xenorhabdus bovienii TaxID=40576 RepID=UPI00237CC603|nr:YmfQ family protein [Xenorhabdus bovienii]MDE1476245.1 YmfQ family protein [Xenorhabdus bovienii]MDE1484074.1 YmfQ family protein [Xenorhabdus bovienii]MDE9437486.1 YmfQ family protein [Xenorhabdus bovienii]MDE9443336.1 YmfQ family protein [Xenorhabdus bovienii]MDE9495930.1 YmfQ family protein [Xenorhabdus bovienii]